MRLIDRSGLDGDQKKQQQQHLVPLWCTPGVPGGRTDGRALAASIDPDSAGYRGASQSAAAVVLARAAGGSI